MDLKYTAKQILNISMQKTKTKTKNNSIWNLVHPSIIVKEILNFHQPITFLDDQV